MSGNSPLLPLSLDRANGETVAGRPHSEPPNNSHRQSAARGQDAYGLAVVANLNDGESLRDKLAREGELPITEAIRILA